MHCWTNSLTNTHSHNWRFSLLLCLQSTKLFEVGLVFVPYVKSFCLASKATLAFVNITNSLTLFLMFCLLSIPLITKHNYLLNHHFLLNIILHLITFYFSSSPKPWEPFKNLYLFLSSQVVLLALVSPQAPLFPQLESESLKVLVLK